MFLNCNKIHKKRLLHDENTESSQLLFFIPQKSQHTAADRRKSTH